VIEKKNDEYVPVSTVDDYVYRPEKYADVSLYDWIQLAVKYTVDKRKGSNIEDDGVDNNEEPDVEFKNSEDPPDTFNTGQDDIDETSAPRISMHMKKTAQSVKDSMEYES
jgi:hypothetical protein